MHALADQLRMHFVPGFAKCATVDLFRSQTERIVRVNCFGRHYLVKKDQQWTCLGTKCKLRDEFLADKPGVYPTNYNDLILVGRRGVLSNLRINGLPLYPARQSQVKIDEMPEDRVVIRSIPSDAHYFLDLHAQWEERTEFLPWAPGGFVQPNGFPLDGADGQIHLPNGKPKDVYLSYTYCDSDKPKLVLH